MSPPRRSPTTFTRLTDAETAALERWLNVRNRLAAAEIDTVQARVRMRIACAFLRALKPDSPRRTALEADLLRRQADGLQRSSRAAAASRWLRAKFVRATYQLVHGNGDE
jgi:hypothetical protein